MGGYTYGEQEPKEKCPYCGTWCHADFVDIGLGFIQCGPYHCDNCGASEISPGGELSLDGTGWYPPGSPPGPNANVDDAGRHIPHYEADTLYRASRGVEPRYDKYGRYIKDE